MTNALSSNLSIRDPRLDFFRGAGMFIILIAHITDNPWTLYIPARFGFSDATEIFVFCSGMASAIAFGGVFAKAGWLMGSLRIVHRVWQVYWAHIGVFLTTVMTMQVLNLTGWFSRDYLSALNLNPFIYNTGPNLVGLMTLTYVPNYFDILPMYLVILAMIPAMMALARLHPMVPVAASAALWAYVSIIGLNLPAELWFTNNSARQWFFNPFAWQLVFFTGFALMAGWLPAPPVNRWLVALAVAVLILSVPLAWHKSISAFEAVRDWRKANVMLFDKTSFGVLRYLHFLALAYLALVLAGPKGAHLNTGRYWAGFVSFVSKVGQQSLAVFMTSMVLARVLGVALDVTGRGALAALAVNLLGFACISAVAVLVGYIKRSPWKTGPKYAAQGLPPSAPAPASLASKVRS